jgi:hypothetical protein
MTLSAISSFIICNDSSASTKQLSLGNASKFYGTISLLTSTGTYTLSGNTGTGPTIQTLLVAAGNTLLTTAARTINIASFPSPGTDASNITLDSTTTGSYTWNFTGTGRVSVNYMNIQHCLAVPANTWYAGKNSTNNQDVATAGSGWIFDDAPYIQQPGGSGTANRGAGHKAKTEPDIVQGHLIVTTQEIKRREMERIVKIAPEKLRSARKEEKEGVIGLMQFTGRFPSTDYHKTRGKFR